MDTDTSPKSHPTVGFVGLGLMGRGIARNLDAAGLLVAATDLAPDAFHLAEFSSRVRNEPVASMAESCDILLFAVPSSHQIAQAAIGENGFAGRSAPGQIIVDLTTSDPDVTRNLARSLTESGWHYVDAAMTGGAAGADAGTLTLMIGGEENAVAYCRPVFDAFAQKTFHLGPTGSGQAMKLIHNMILHTTFLATCEGCRLAERAGLDLATVVDVLNAGNARSFVSEVRFPRHIVSGTFDARSYVSTLAKDLGMAVSFAERQGPPPRFGSLTYAMLDEARNKGFGGEDFSRLYQHFDALADSLSVSRSAPRRETAE